MLVIIEAYILPTIPKLNMPQCMRVAELPVPAKFVKTAVPHVSQSFRLQDLKPPRELWHTTFCRTKAILEDHLYSCSSLNAGTSAPTAPIVATLGQSQAKGSEHWASLETSPPSKAHRVVKASGLLDKL